MKCLILWLFMVMCISNIEAQEREFKKENFPGKEPRFKRALQAYLLGNSLFSEGENSYYLAKSAYQEAYSFNPNDALLNYHMGICYLKTAEKLKAKTFFTNAALLNNKVTPKINYYFGVCYQLESQWDSALNYYKIYEKEIDSITQRNDWLLTAKRKLECINGNQLSLKRNPAIITNLGPNINTNYNEYTPYVSTDESKLFFTSRRLVDNVNNIDENDGLYYEDIFLSFKKNGIMSSGVDRISGINSR